MKDLFAHWSPRARRRAGLPELNSPQETKTEVIHTNPDNLKVTVEREGYKKTTTITGNIGTVTTSIGCLDFSQLNPRIPDGTYVNGIKVDEENEGVKIAKHESGLPFFSPAAQRGTADKPAEMKESIDLPQIIPPNSPRTR